MIDVLSFMFSVIGLWLFAVCLHILLARVH